jgi:hypothetical protein
MEIIKCTSYEKRLLIRYLEQVKKEKMETKIRPGKFDDTLYDIQQIELLIQRVNGNPPRQSYQRDSLAYTHEPKKEQETKENWKYYNRKRGKDE